MVVRQPARTVPAAFRQAGVQVLHSCAGMRVSLSGVWAEQPATTGRHLGPAGARRGVASRRFGRRDVPRCDGGWQPAQLDGRTLSQGAAL